MNYIQINKNSWNKRTEIHVKSDFYDVKGFLQGNNSLSDIELKGLGDIKNKSILHLQCHFGLDTLSLARLGAMPTGVDFSPTAINKAKELAEKTSLNARFICSDIQSFETPGQQYDIVFTSFGVLCWLPDLDQWAQCIAKHLKPGGTFFMAEFHPVHDLISGYSYFHKPEPDVDRNKVNSV